MKNNEPDNSVYQKEATNLENLRANCPGTAKQNPANCAVCQAKLNQELTQAISGKYLSRQVELLKFLATCYFDLKLFDQAKSYLTQLVQINNEGFELPDLLVLYNYLGRIGLIQSELKVAAENFTKALELSEAKGMLDNAGGMCLNLSNVFDHLGKPEKCHEYLQKAVEMFTATGNANLLQMAKSSLALHYFSIGEHAKALDLKQRCIDYYTESGDKVQLAKELSTIAVFHFNMGNLYKAIENSLSALKLKEEQGDTYGIASNWLNLGAFYSEYGDDEAALQYYLQALPVFEKLGVKHSVSMCLNNISNYYLSKNEDQVALEYLFKSVKLRQEIQEEKNIAMLYLNIAEIYRISYANYTQAQEYYDLAINHAQQCQEGINLSSARLGKAVNLAMLNQGDEAMALLETTSKEIYTNRWKRVYHKVFRAEADIYQALSRYQEACTSIRKYAELMQEQQIEDGQSKIAKMRAIYEADKKEKEAEIYRLKTIELQEKNAQIEEQKNKLQETLDRLYQSEIRYDFMNDELTRNIGTTLIGSSQTIRKITQLIAMVAQADHTNVLITGETGTGKEIVARNIHLCSKRGKQHFYAVNCSAIPENLFESQFFGHEKDAFTGATSTKIGWFEIANNSTLFLDEIGSLSFDQQAKLLRALEERCIVRVGSHRETPLDLRIVSATNVNLLSKVELEEFRRDLYHRLAVIVINITPLRNRREDIPLLLKHFVGLAAQALNKKITKVNKDVMAYLADYDFPGNVRELRNMVERAVLMADSSTLQREHFLIPHTSVEAKPESGIVPLDVLERCMILKALQSTGYNRVQSAKLLGVDRKVVERKILKYNIEVPR
jgi:DNA-binding NtrC family response regulator